MVRKPVNLWKHVEKTKGICTFNEAVRDILHLRELHKQMDETVLKAYCWQDIDLAHDFYDVDYLPENDRIRFTISPDARKEGSVSNLDQHISGSRRNQKSKGCPKIQLHNSNLREVSAVETRCLKEQVRRNIERFLEDFNV